MRLIFPAPSVPAWYRRVNSSNRDGSWLYHLRSSVDGATALHQWSMWALAVVSPRGHSRSTSTRMPSPWAGGSYNPTYPNLCLLCHRDLSNFRNINPRNRDGAEANPRGRTVGWQATGRSPPLGMGQVQHEAVNGTAPAACSTFAVTEVPAAADACEHVTDGRRQRRSAHVSPPRGRGTTPAAPRVRREVAGRPSPDRPS